jgi:predicted nucleotidyltransferase component of viral defense system
MSFNNRRMKRGAEMYDLFRALRRERSQAKELNIWTELCRLEKKWNDEDEAERDGRKAYMPPQKALANLLDKGSLPRGEILVKGKAL